MTKQEYIGELISVGVVGIDKPWDKMTMDEKARYAIYIDPKRANEVDIARISNGEGRAEFISRFPKTAKRYDINKLDAMDLSLYIISKAPSLLKRLEKRKVATLQWGFILPKQPQLARYCDFSTLSASDWAMILIQQPQLVDRFDAGRFTDVSDWYMLVKSYPPLWRKCPFESFAHEEKLKLASVSMRLLKKLDWKSFSRNDWRIIIGCHISESKSVKGWVASELRRLSDQLKLPN